MLSSAFDEIAVDSSEPELVGTSGQRSNATQTGVMDRRETAWNLKRVKWSSFKSYEAAKG